MDSQLDLAELPGAFDEAFGLPQPNWELIYKWVQPRIPEGGWAAAWDSIAEQWLLTLGQRLGPEYHLRRTGRFLTLDALPDRNGNALVAFANTSLTALEQIFARLERPAIPGRRVIIFFADRRSYYSYVSHFKREGIWATSGGMYLRPRYGYRHTVVAPGQDWHLRGATAHELTHHVLDHLRLPRWIEEGLTEMMNERLTAVPSFGLDRETARRHREHWSRVGLQEFWLGRSYGDPESQELSFNLSQVLIRRLAADFPAKFFDFLRDASRDDAGDGSARTHLGMDLQAIAATFLGPGDWSIRDGT
jgi:hypothetical protein